MKVFVIVFIILFSSCSYFSQTALDTEIHYDGKTLKKNNPDRVIAVYDAITDSKKELILLGTFTWCYTSDSTDTFQKGRLENALIELRKEAVLKGGDALVVHKKEYVGSCLNIVADLLSYKE